MSSVQDQEIKLFARLVEYNCGIVIDEGRSEALETSILVRMAELAINDPLAYYYYLRNNHDRDQEFKELVDLITINETSFFRYQAQFDALRAQIIPKLLARDNSAQRLRIWSAGCATGEEPYSIAMMVNDMELAKSGWDVEIIGTDISSETLKAAETGIYREQTMRNMHPDLKQRYFKPLGNNKYEIDDQIKAMVRFSYFNLVKRPYPLYYHDMDIILCRNVLIYFKEDTIGDILDEFRECLSKDGIFMAGHSENLYAFTRNFISRESQGAFYYQSASDLSNKPRGMQAKPEEEPKEAEAIRNAFGEAVEAGEHDKALELSEKLLAIDENNVKIRLERANIMTNISRYGDAIEEACIALEKEPFLTEATFMIAIAQINLGNLDRGIEFLKKTIFIDKEHALAHFYLANIYRDKNDIDLALKEYGKTLKSLDGNPEGEWSRFCGGYNTDVLRESCRGSINQLSRRQAQIMQTD